jgi:hypothetical protein
MIHITFTSDPLPEDFQGTLEDFRERFLLNLRGTIDDTAVLTGQIGGARPTTNVGPWLNNGTWYVWNGADYVPTTVKVGGSNYVVQLSNEFVASKSVVPNRVQTLQDKDGTVALLSDVYEGRAVVTLTGTTPTIDWSLSHQFSQLLTGNTTLKQINSKDGQQIWYTAKNGATPYTLTWPAGIYWPAGVAPTQSGANKTDLYILTNIGGSVIGRQVAGYV